MTYLKLLGTAQDGGIPHLGCRCTACNEPMYHRLVASLLIHDGEVTVIDATPDFTAQERSIGGKTLQIDRIMITHLHIGHYTGLLHLGKEVFSATLLPVFVSAPVGEFLRKNKPFSYLVERGEIELFNFVTNEPIQIGPSTTIAGLEVPHRNEDGDTHGFVITNIRSGKKCLYLPDVDYITESLTQTMRSMDVVIFDGSFWTKHDLPRQHDVPHPPMKDVIDLFEKNTPPTRFIFTHFNHTNPVLHDAKLKEFIEERGFEIAYDGMELEL